MNPTIDRTRIRNEILDLLKNNGHKSYRPKEIARRLNYRENEEYRASREIMHELAQAGEIAKIKGGRFTLRPKPEAGITGTLTVNPRGFGFVTVEDEPDDFFVAAENLGVALDGDHVEIKLFRPSRGDGRREAAVERVVERKRSQVVGTFVHEGNRSFVEPDDQRIPHRVFIPARERGDAQEGDKVVASIEKFNDPDRGPLGHVSEVLGRADDPRIASLALAMSQDIRIGFPDEILEFARVADERIPQSEYDRRLDLRDKPIFTIDPVDAKDFDDAIHILSLPNGNLEVGVHIADVSHYVERGSAVDAEAYERGTSVYLVDRVIPMLPERLSNDLCSLNPYTDKLAFSCLMEMTPEGERVGYEIRETVINSKERFTYEQAQEILDGTLDHALAEDVRRANTLAETLTEQRMSSGSVDFSTPEVRIVLDEHGHPVDIVRKPRLQSNRLIEELMLLANRTVAEHWDREHAARPFVYRIHGKPDEERIQALAEYVQIFGYSLRLRGGNVRPQDLSALIRKVRGTQHEAIVEQAAIRSMAKAVYSTDNIGHFGLGFAHYTHFTSPIRRYPDLIVHRLLKERQAGKESRDVASLSEKCRHTSAQERAAETAERESVKMMQVEYMQDHVGSTYHGVINGVAKFGLFVELPELLVEGLVHVRDMNGYWEYDERQYALVERNGKRRFKLGDTLDVVVAAADRESRQIDFVPAK